MQLIWRNVGYIAKPGTPEARAIEAGYSPSLLASAPVLSLPEPERKSVLVEANTLFLADLLGFGMDLQRTYRQGYAFDPRNSAITQVRPTADALVLDVLAHYATGSIAVPQPGTPPGMPQPSAPKSLPDPRSMFLTIAYSLAPLPAEPMHGRRADPRVGYFESGRFDFSNDLQRTPRQRFVNRWRLEKKDPDAALSEPVKPIVFWIDRTVPVKYRAVDHRRRPRMEQGVREDRLQERGPGRGPARERRLRHARLRPLVDPLDDQRVADLRRDRPEPRRPAQRRDPRRRHRPRESVVAQHPRRALADPVGERRRQPVPRRRSDAARAVAPACRGGSAPTARWRQSR